MLPALNRAAMVLAPTAVPRLLLTVEVVIELTLPVILLALPVPELVLVLVILVILVMLAMLAMLADVLLPLDPLLEAKGGMQSLLDFP